MKTAVGSLLACAAVSFCLCGCATSRETAIRRPLYEPSSPKLSVGVLPPRVDASLRPSNLEGEPHSILMQLMDGRGAVVGSANASRDIALETVSTLTQAGTFSQVFIVKDREEAERLGVDSLLAISVRDYRTVLLGANGSGFWMYLTSPLMSRYWIRWQTIEARFDWEAQLFSMDDGEMLYSKRLQRSYTSPVRSATGGHFANKMLSFLQNRTAPDFIGDLFSLPMIHTPDASLKTTPYTY